MEMQTSTWDCQGRLQKASLLILQSKIKSKLQNQTSKKQRKEALEASYLKNLTKCKQKLY